MAILAACVLSAGVCGGAGRVCANAPVAAKEMAVIAKKHASDLTPSRILFSCGSFFFTRFLVIS